MKKSIFVFVFFWLFARLTVLLSGSFQMPLSDIFTVLAFSIPVFCGTVISERDRKRREEEAGVSLPEAKLLSIEKKGMMLCLPLVFPTVALVFLTAYVSQLLLSWFGVVMPKDETGNVIISILTGAAVPSVLEEMMFRYLPMKLILPYSKKWTVAISALGFALFHPHIGQYFYALVAGIIFILADIAFDSVIPSLVFHFTNNLLSVIYVNVGENTLYVKIFAISLAVCAAISFALAVALRKKYAPYYRNIKSGARGIYG